MELTVRPLNNADYQDFLVGWWNDWGMTAVPKDFLPQDGTGGIMVMDGEEHVCAGFMYATNSKIAWVDWIVSNKEYRKKPHRITAIKLLLETLTNIAKNTGHKYSYALIKNSKLVDHYVGIGYTKSCGYTEELIKKCIETSNINQSIQTQNNIQNQTINKITILNTGCEDISILTQDEIEEIINNGLNFVSNALLVFAEQ